MMKLFFAALSFLIFIISGCAGCPNVQKNDICDIFRKNPKWYRYARSSFEKWEVPIPVMMAIMHKESGFKAKAKPARTTCLFIFPGPRPSSAYGYSQAIDSTWRIYQQNTGNLRAERDKFDDAIDFIGWYCHMSHLMCGISKSDTYNLYLAYHEGQRGFNQGSYNKKDWLKKVARSAKNITGSYTRQLASCEKEFQKKDKGCCLWPLP